MSARFLIVGCLIAVTAGVSAQPVAPAVTNFTINNGAPQTTSDQVTLRWSYTHPAGPGQPVAWVRIRYKAPGQPWPTWSAWKTGTEWNATTAMSLATVEGAPIAGTHEFEIQLRDRLEQLSATVRARITRTTVDLTALARPSQRYQADGREAMRLAQQTGFGFARVVIKPFSACVLSPYDNGIEASIVQTNTTLGATPRCRFDFFTNKKLRDGWRLVGAHVTNDDNPQVLAFQQRPSGSGVPFFSIEVIRNYKGRLEHIVLEGPPGADWRDAFRY